MYIKGNSQDFKQTIMYNIKKKDTFCHSKKHNINYILYIHYATKLSQQNFSSKFCYFSNAHNSINFHHIKTIFFFIL